MTIPELAVRARNAESVTIPADEARALAATYAEACARCHDLSTALRAREAANAYLTLLAASRLREIARLEMQAEFDRRALAAALAGKAAA